MSPSISVYLEKFKAGRVVWNDFRQYRPKVHLSGFELGEVDVSGYNLGGLDLSNADIRGFHVETFSRDPLALMDAKCSVMFRQARLVGVKAVGAQLADADFGGADLRAADFRGADLYGVSLFGADCREADFSEALLDDACLTNCRLDGCRLFNTRLPQWSLHLKRGGRANWKLNPEYATVDLSHACWTPDYFDRPEPSRTPVRIRAELARQERYEESVRSRRRLEDEAHSLYGLSVDQLSPEDLEDLLS
jgi:hypothetical protein